MKFLVFLLLASTFYVAMGGKVGCCMAPFFTVYASRFTESGNDQGQGTIRTMSSFPKQIERFDVNAIYSGQFYNYTIWDDYTKKTSFIKDHTNDYCYSEYINGEFPINCFSSSNAWKFAGNVYVGSTKSILLESYNSSSSANINFILTEEQCTPAFATIYDAAVGFDLSVYWNFTANVDNKALISCVPDATKLPERSMLMKHIPLLRRDINIASFQFAQNRYGEKF